MIDEKSLFQHYSGLQEIYKRALDDVLWHLDNWLKNPAYDKAARVYTASRVSSRVKSYESLLRKCSRDAIESLDEISARVEDLLGIRIATPNKDSARMVFEHFRSMKSAWFCSIVSEPKFVPYTFSASNKYSSATGYQAYHVTFVYERDFSPVTAYNRWSVEIQIMAQLWEFWAEYSRTYFYAASTERATQLAPYNAAISRILDSADDLMVATTELLLHGESEKPPAPAGTEAPVAQVPSVTLETVHEWIAPNLARFFGERAKIPIDLFLSKIAEEMNLHRVSFEDVERFLEDEKITRLYDRILAASNVGYLPPYQKILLTILLGMKWDIPRALERVNNELALLGFHLQVPRSDA